MNSDYLDDRHFDKLDNKILVELLVLFEKDPNTNSDVFFEIKDNIWEEGTCYPDFYIMVPQLIRIASGLDISISKDLWSYLGCWISTQKHCRKDVCGEILDDFDKALEYAENECINQICTIEKFDDLDAQYIYASLFSFIKHRLGYMTLASYKDDLVGTSISKCPDGHMNDFSIYNTCIVEYEGEEKACNVTGVEYSLEEFPEKKHNPWRIFLHRFLNIIDSEEISPEIKSHFELSALIVSRGVTQDLDLKYAFSLYGCLLYCNGSFAESMRIFHAWDKVCCNKCKKIFTFAEGWCEDFY